MPTFFPSTFVFFPRLTAWISSAAVERCSPGASKEEVKEKAQKNNENMNANPVEDAVSGLDVLREDPTDPRADAEALLQVGMGGEGGGVNRDAISILFIYP